MIEYRSTLPRAVYAAALAEAEPGLGGDGTGPLEEKALEPRLDGNTLHFVSVHGRLREVPFDALHSIRVDVHRASGAFEGAGLGFLTGFGVGALAGFAAGSDPFQSPNTDAGTFSFTAAEKALVLGVAGGVVGLGLGTLVGALVGHRDVVELAGDN